MKLNRKKVLWTVGALLGVLLVLCIGGSFLIDHVARGIVEKNLSAISGREIHVGRVSLGFIRPRVRAWDIKIHNPSGYPHPVMLTMPYLEAVYDREALKRNHLLISLLRIDADRLELHERQDGKVNIMEWGSVVLPAEFFVTNGPPAKASAPAAQTNSNAGAEPSPVVLGNMVYDGIQMLEVNLKECQFTSDLYPNRNMERICNLHERYPNVKGMQDYQAITVVLGMKTGVLFLLNPQGKQPQGR